MAAGERSSSEVDLRPARPFGILQRHRKLLGDVVSVYGVQFGNYVVPLATVPYLSRVLGPSMWGLTAMAQAFATTGHIVVEYGFIYSATRDLARAGSDAEIEQIIAGVSGARLILALVVIALALAASYGVALFRQNPLLLWTAVIAEILKAALPNYYFYGMQRVRTASFLDISARLAALAGVFFLVKKPSDAWIFFALQGAGALIVLVAAESIMYRKHSIPWPRLRHSCRVLREGAPMFLFRGCHNLFLYGNAFILGLFTPPQAVGYYAGAEKINSAASNLVAPITTALFPRAASMTRESLPRAARFTSMTLLVTMLISLVLALGIWLTAPWAVPFILGRQYGPSVGVEMILALRAPLIGWASVLGVQWLLVLGLERPFQNLTLAALIFNAALAAVVAPRFSYTGMGWVVVLSQTVFAIGIYWILERRGLSPFRLRREVWSV